MHTYRKLLAAIWLATVAIVPNVAQERVFFGNLHSHTSYSDGTGTPQQAFQHAREIAKIDFLALTEHNHDQARGDDGIGIATDTLLYNGDVASSLISSARSMTENGKFVALYGQEFSTISSGNHVNVFDISNVINIEKGRFDLLAAFLNTNLDSLGQPAIMMLNHPENEADLLPKEYGLDDFGSDPAVWLNRISKHARLIQMINGPGQREGTNLDSASPDETAFKKFLNIGLKVAPTADQDNHTANWGNATRARTAVVANSLSKASVLDALRSRHVYASEDENLSIVIKVNGRLCGDVIAPLPAPGELTISYSITDKDEPGAEYEIQVWRDAVGGQFAKMVSAVETNEGSGTIEDVAFSGEPQFFYFKVVQVNEDGDRDRAWTAPVWFQSQPDAFDSPSTPVIPPDGAVSAFVASKRSQVYHVSIDCLDAKRIKEANLVRGSAARNGRRLHENCPRRTPN